MSISDEAAAKTASAMDGVGEVSRPCGGKVTLEYHHVACVATDAAFPSRKRGIEALSTVANKRFVDSHDAQLGCELRHALVGGDDRDRPYGGHGLHGSDSVLQHREDQELPLRW